MYDTLIRIDIASTEIDARRRRLDACTRFENTTPPVWIFADSPFYCRAAGIAIEDMYETPEAMLQAQLLGWKTILEKIDCDVPGVPVGLDFGSCLTASTYGCELVAQPGSVPGFRPWFEGDSDLKRLEAIDVCSHGLRGREVEYYHRFRELADQYAVQYGEGEPEFPARWARLNTGSEGPFSIACMIAGFDRVGLWCYDRPKLVTQLLALILEKEIARIRHSFQVMAEAPGPIGIADDYSPYVSLAIYEELVLPTQLQLRDVFGKTVDFHSCIPDPKLLAHWRDDLSISLFNGFKPQHGLGNLARDYTPVAQAMGGRVLLEPDLDGANLMTASREDLRRAVREFLSVFHPNRGVKLGATLSGGHRLDDLDKLNVLREVAAE